MKPYNPMKEFSFSTIDGNKYCLTVLRTSKSGVVCNVKDNYGKTIEDVYISNKNFVECVATDTVYKVEFVEKQLKCFKCFMNVYTVQLSSIVPWK